MFRGWAFSQTGCGLINGTVLGSSGALLQTSAAVTNSVAKVRFATKTTRSGDYPILALLAGTC